MTYVRSHMGHIAAQSFFLHIHDLFFFRKKTNRAGVGSQSNSLLHILSFGGGGGNKRKIREKLAQCARVQNTFLFIICNPVTQC